MSPEIVSPEGEEQARHRSAIESLSEKHHLPLPAVEEVYQRELASFRQGALITAYLPIFVARRVSEVLRSVVTASQETPGGGPAHAQ